MPVFNAEKTIESSVLSLLNQSEKIEIIISDNNSTDNTWTILKRLAKENDNIKIFKNNVNKGPIENFLKVLHLASGNYFFWSAADDLWDSSWVLTNLSVMEENNVSLSFGKVKIINTDEVIIRHPANFNLTNYLSNNNSILRRLIFFLEPEVFGHSAPFYGIFKRNILLAFLNSYKFTDESYVDFLFLFEFIKSNRIEFSSSTHFKMMHNNTWTSKQKSSSFVGVINYFSYVGKLILRSNIFGVFLAFFLPFKLIFFLLSKAFLLLFNSIYFFNR